MLLLIEIYPELFTSKKPVIIAVAEGLFCQTYMFLLIMMKMFSHPWKIQKLNCVLNKT